MNVLYTYYYIPKDTVECQLIDAQLSTIFIIQMLYSDTYSVYWKLECSRILNNK